MKESKLGFIAEPLRTSFRQLINRCEKAGIKHKLERDPIVKKYYLYISLPSGGDERKLRLADLRDAQKLNQVEFEKYVLVQGYQSICSYQDGLIEAYIKPLGTFIVEYAFYRLLDIPYNQLQEMKKDELAFELKHKTDKGNLIIIRISKPTDTILALTRRESYESGLTIKISGLEISNSEEAAAILDKLAKSLFFEIETSLGIPLMLELYREPWIFRGWWLSSKRRVEAEWSPIVFPKYQYDVDPLNLYLYAASAHEMPLLQFLAYYQILEFYFPIYFEKEVQAEVANIMKDPEFNPNHHRDIKKVISAVLSKMRRGYSYERAQLRATIKACVQDIEVRELIENEFFIKEHFKKDYKKLSPLKVSIDNEGSDLREQLAERLYNIRCRIVHTKADDTERERILPFTKEANLLAVEIEIIKFIAFKVLTASRKRLVI